MSTNDFLPENYEAPKTGSGRYMKLVPGENKFRILSKPLIGFEYWTNDNKPVRLREMPKIFPTDIKPDSYGKKQIKHFWALTVYNYAAKQIEILQISQNSIISSITGLVRDSDWGNPFGYDIKINKTGKDKETEYSVIGVPHKPVTDEVKEAYKASPVNLEALFNGGDPFANASANNGAPAQPAQPTPPPAPAPAPQPAAVPVPQPIGIDDLPF